MTDEKQKEKSNEKQDGLSEREDQDLLSRANDEEMEPAVTITDMPEEMRPRERLLTYGAEALPTYELLAILLRTGGKEANAIQLALKVIDHFDTLYDLKQASVEELMEIPNIGQAKAVEIVAAIEFGKRLNQVKQWKDRTINSSQEAGDYFLKELQGLQQEHVMVLYLNTKNEIIRKKTIFIGSLNTSVAHPREIYKEAVRFSAAKIIVAHNHPSGNPEPSEADIQFTERLIQAGDLLGIEMLDHFIIGEGIYTSLREWGI